MGRVSTYNKKTADEICERLCEGEPLRAICRDDHMPAWRTIYDWINANSDFATRIARARELGQDAILEDTLRIADSPLIGEETEESDDGRIKTKRGDMLGHRKLQIETRLKLLAKWNPKKYGDKLQSELTGADGSPLAIQIVRFGAQDDDGQTA